MEDLLVTLCTAMPVCRVATRLGVSDMRLWRTLAHYVEEARAQENNAAALAVGIDEIAARRGHKHISQFHDLHQARRRFACEGRKGTVHGLFYYLYLIVDLYSRKIIRWEFHERASAKHVAALVRRAVLAEGGIDRPLVLHADNGSVRKGSTLLGILQALGIAPSCSRWGVSDDNPFPGALFRTCKYHPDYPVGRSADLTAAPQWAPKLVHWYNSEHRHSSLRFVTPQQQRHTGRDNGIRERCQRLYRQAKEGNRAPFLVDAAHFVFESFLRVCGPLCASA